MGLIVIRAGVSHEITAGLHMLLLLQVGDETTNQRTLHSVLFTARTTPPRRDPGHVKLRCTEGGLHGERSGTRGAL